MVNRVIPAELASQNIPDYLRNRMRCRPSTWIKIDKTFGDNVVARVPEFERDITGLAMIEKVGRCHVWR